VELEGLVPFLVVIGLLTTSPGPDTILVSHARRLVTMRVARRVLDAACGAVLVGLGTRLALARR
jgi:threonine/homoserine/homoserine lactone efflux protein